MQLAGIPQMTPELAWIFSILLAPCKAKAQFGQLPPPRAARTAVEGALSLPGLAGEGTDLRPFREGLGEC